MKTIAIAKTTELNAEGKWNSNHCKTVVCYKMDGSELSIVSSVRDVAEKLGTAPSYVSKCLTENNGICKGYRIVPVMEIVTLLPEFVSSFNGNANDAKKWQAMQAEQEAIRKAEEDRIAAERKAEAERLAAIEKAEKKIARHQAAYEKFHKEMVDAALKLRDAQYELSQLTGEVEPDVA